MENKRLRLHDSVEATSTLVLECLEELQYCLLGKYDCGASDCLFKMFTKSFGLEAARSGCLRPTQILQVLHREPNPVSGHSIDIIVLAEGLVRAPIDRFNLHKKLSHAQPCHFVE